MKKNNNKKLEQDLFKTLISIKKPELMANFLKDLCTPQELTALAERWHVCKLLHEGNLSYREINDLTGASLATITRVARFLKDEPHHGYQAVLKNNSVRTLRRAQGERGKK
ncbi:MAG: YerC/YecD family TrpR-related protein [Candidatus Babeliales bacterium]